ncbi:MAG TPA: hypothetical protein VK616_19610 [Flavitalea sp.]|nr:hypothetical protein [Flavitalea sp.]
MSVLNTYAFEFEGNKYSFDTFLNDQSEFCLFISDTSLVKLIGCTAFAFDICQSSEIDKVVLVSTNKDATQVKTVLNIIRATLFEELKKEPFNGDFAHASIFLRAFL